MGRAAGGVGAGGWDLNELVGAPGLEKRLAALRRRAASFARERGSLDPGMDAASFARLLRMLDRLARDAGVLHGYASLLHSADTQSGPATALLGRMAKVGADVSNRSVYFDLWWQNGIDGENAERLMAGSGELRDHLAHERRLARHSLAEPEEKIINTLDATGASAMARLYDKITGAFRYKVGAAGGPRRGRGARLTREEVAALIRSPSASTRRAAYRSLLSAHSGSRGVLGEIYQNIARNWSDEGVEIRKHRTPLSVRNADNDVSDGAVSALLESCRGNAGVFRRFFKAKAGMIGAGRLRRYDLYAPAPPPGRRPRKRYGYAAAARLVLESLGGFSPALAAHARRVVDGGHVDWRVRPGKRDGAFCSSPSPDVVPYVLLSFTGCSRDVFTLAHELGHAVHSMAAAGRSALVHQAPLPLAETASTFSELLLHDALSEKADARERRAMLAEEIDDLYATVMRQSHFTAFEVEAHRMITDSAAPGDLSRAYLSGLREQFGGSVDVSEDFADEWACIPHFFHAPFYCYAYSFGNLLALSLFQRYKREGRDFARSYEEILAAGGSRNPEALLAEHGMDVSSGRFWQDGFDYISGQVGELERSA